jgi:hypothetical protein
MTPHWLVLQLFLTFVPHFPMSPEDQVFPLPWTGPSPIQMPGPASWGQRGTHAWQDAETEASSHGLEKEGHAGGIDSGFSSPAFEGQGLDAKGHVSGTGGGKPSFLVLSCSAEWGGGRGLREFNQTPSSPASEVKSFSA